MLIADSSTSVRTSHLLMARRMAAASPRCSREITLPLMSQFSAECSDLLGPLHRGTRIEKSHHRHLLRVSARRASDDSASNSPFVHYSKRGCLMSGEGH